MSWVNAIISGILLGGLYSLFATGLSLMFGVMKVINLAHGDLAVIGAYLALAVVNIGILPTVWSWALVVPALALIGYFLQRTLIQASLERGPLTTLLVTFGLSIVIENALLQFVSANSYSLPVGSLATAAFHIGGVSIAYGALGIFVVAAVVLLGLQRFLSSSRQGRLIRAVADDREAAQLSGADYRHVFGVAAAIAFGTVALAGIAYGGVYSQFDPTLGNSQLLLYAFEAVVIGGLGSLWGTLAGGVLLGVVQQIGAQIGPQDQALAGQLVFLAILAFLPQGITGGRRRTA